MSGSKLPDGRRRYFEMPLPEIDRLTAGSMTGATAAQANTHAERPAGNAARGVDKVTSKVTVQQERPTSQAPANDCEIIVADNADKKYVYAIERTLRSFGLKVDVMIPCTTSGKFASLIGHLGKQGTIFVIVVRPENVAHKSVTVHVLRGPEPQEHRNMALEQAYVLIQQVYTNLKRSVMGPMPEDLKDIVRNVLAERSVKDDEYATLIAHLQQRRQQQYEFEYRNKNDRGRKLWSEEDLQQRILATISGSSKSKNK